MPRFIRTRRAASWLLNLENRRPGMLASMSRPAEQFGFGLIGNEGAMRWGFGPYSIEQNAAGRWFIPSGSRVAAEAGETAGKWGTFAEWRTAASATGGLRRAAGQFLHPALNLFFAWSFYNEARAHGAGVLGAAAESTKTLATWGLVGRFASPVVAAGWPAAVALAPVAAAVGYIYYRNKVNKFEKSFASRIRQTEFVGDMSMFNTGAAYTMRQRSAMAIRRSFLNARTALGSETRPEHMPHMYGHARFAPYTHSMGMTYGY